MSKPRRVVKRSTRIPSISELYGEASKRGMTVQEYMEVLNILNRRSNREKSRQSRKP